MFGVKVDRRDEECVADLASKLPSFFYVSLPNGPNRIGLAEGGEYLAGIGVDKAAVEKALKVMYCLRHICILYHLR